MLLDDAKCRKANPEDPMNRQTILIYLATFIITFGAATAFLVSKDATPPQENVATTKTEADSQSTTAFNIEEKCIAEMKAQLKPSAQVTDADISEHCRCQSLLFNSVAQNAVLKTISEGPSPNGGNELSAETQALVMQCRAITMKIMGGG